MKLTEENNEQPVSDFNFEPEFEEIVEPLEAESVEESEEVLETAPAEEQQDTPEEIVEDATPRAQKRIQALNKDKKNLSEENKELLALVEQLKRSNDIQTQLQERQNQYLSAQDNQTKQTNRRQLMIQYGLNPADQRDAILFEEMEYKAELEKKFNDMQEQLQRQQDLQIIEQFNRELDSGLASKLSSYNVDKDVISDIREAAYDIAALHGVTAVEAASLAIKRYQRVLPKKNKAAKAAKVDDAAKAVTMGNRSKGKAPGRATDDEDSFLSMLTKGDFRL